MFCPDKVPSSQLPVLATKVSSVPPCRAIIWHEAPARKRLRKKCCYGSVKRCQHEYRAYWSESWTAWEPVTWRIEEDTSVRRSMCRFERKTAFSLILLRWKCCFLFKSTHSSSISCSFFSVSRNCFSSSSRSVPVSSVFTLASFYWTVKTLLHVSLFLAVVLSDGSMWRFWRNLCCKDRRF